MKKGIALLSLICSLHLSSQNTTKSDFWNHVHYGGGLGLSFRSNNTTVSISPSALYEFNDQFSLGASLGYLYNKQNSLTSNVFSASIISLYNPISQIQVSAELEQLFVNQNLLGFKNNYNYPALYLGVAYRFGMASLGIRYDILYDKDTNIYISPISPIIRFYF
ncbi:hypothetical protein V2611_00235 [Tenacibaculum maritimum]|uniref:hypothetical protein n=1 Tax=Tenacibaculum maritimum TaxID=107401 RepID=UPI003875F7A4